VSKAKEANPMQSSGAMAGDTGARIAQKRAEAERAALGEQREWEQLVTNAITNRATLRPRHAHRGPAIRAHAFLTSGTICGRASNAPLGVRSVLPRAAPPGTEPLAQEPENMATPRAEPAFDELVIELDLPAIAAVVMAQR